MTLVHGDLNAVPSIPALERHFGARVRGTLIRSHLDWVRFHRSREETIEFFELLSRETRSVCATIQQGSWYSFAVVLEIESLISGIFGDGRLDLLEGLGSFFAADALSGPPSQEPGRAVAHAALHRAAMLLHHHVDVASQPSYVPTGLSSGNVILCDQSSSSEWFCAVSKGAYRQSLLALGNASVQLTHRFCQAVEGQVCAFEVSWS